MVPLQLHLAPYCTVRPTHEQPYREAVQRLKECQVTHKLRYFGLVMTVYSFWVRIQVSDPEVATQLEQDASPNASQTSLPPEFLSTTYKAAVRTWVVLMRTCLCLSLRLDSEPCIQLPNPGSAPLRRRRLTSPAAGKHACSLGQACTRAWVCVGASFLLRHVTSVLLVPDPAAFLIPFCYDRELANGGGCEMRPEVLLGALEKGRCVCRGTQQRSQVNC